MGEFCVQHEQQQKCLRRRRVQRPLSATVVVSLAFVGALVARGYLR
jgi:hypothetical protein